MKRDKIIKISLIFAIFFILGIFAVRASTNISLKNVSDYGSYLTVATNEDSIDGSYFDDNNLMVLNYQIFEGFNQVENSTFKVRLEGLEGYDEAMINSCIKLFTKGTYVNSFQVAINYRNYLNYCENNTLEGGETLFPDTFKVVVFGEIEGEEIVAVEKTIKIKTTTNTRDTYLDIEPFASNTSNVPAPYTFLNLTYNEDIGIYEADFNLVVGSWEDKTYTIFDYYLFDSSSPRNDLKPKSTTTALDVSSENPIEGLNISVTDNANDFELEGNNKLLIEYTRPSNEAIEKKSTSYVLTFLDVNGKETNLLLNINFQQYRRISYQAGISNSEIKNSAIVRESTEVVKANANGDLHIEFSTPTYQVRGLDILDADLNLMDKTYFDASSSPSTFKVDLNTLETGWYTLLLYSSSSELPSNGYSFYFEKESINNNVVLIHNNTKQNINPTETTDIPLESPGGWVFFDNSVYIGNREVLISPYYYVNTYSYNTYFDDFIGALYIDSTELTDFTVDIRDLGQATTTYKFTVSNIGESNYSIGIDSFDSVLQIPTEEGAQSTAEIYTTIYKNGAQVYDLDYNYTIYLDGKEVSSEDVYVEIGETTNEEDETGTIVQTKATDKIFVNYGALPGTYTFKISLNDYPEVFYNHQLRLVYPSGTNVTILKIMNKPEIAVPKEKGYKNIVNLDGRVIKNGVQIDAIGAFAMDKEVEGVSLANGTITVLDTATIGSTFNISFIYDDITVSKEFKLVEETDDNNSGIVDGDDNPIPDGTEVSSIVLRGFDSDRLDTKFLTFSDTSGSSKTISYTCYDKDGNVVSNPNLSISGSDVANGILIVPDYSNKTITVYANGLYDRRNFNLTFMSENKTILNQAVTACKPAEWDCSIDFEKYYFTRNASFSAKGSFTNLFDTDTNVSLVLVLYDKNNKIVKYDINSATLKAGETKDFRAKFLMSADIDDITVKAFFVNGLSLTDASKIYTNSRTITNKEGV